MAERVIQTQQEVEQIRNFLKDYKKGKEKGLHKLSKHTDYPNIAKYSVSLINQLGEKQEPIVLLIDENGLQRFANNYDRTLNNLSGLINQAQEKVNAFNAELNSLQAYNKDGVFNRLIQEVELKLIEAKENLATQIAQRDAIETEKASTLDLFRADLLEVLSSDKKDESSVKK